MEDTPLDQVAEKYPIVPFPDECRRMSDEKWERHFNLWNGCSFDVSLGHQIEVIGRHFRKKNKTEQKKYAQLIAPRVSRFARAVYARGQSFFPYPVLLDAIPFSHFVL